MEPLSLRDAADLLGVSLDTVRRKVKANPSRYQRRHDARGWTMITIPDDELPAGSRTAPVAADTVPTAETALPYALAVVPDAALLAQVMQERDHLQAQVTNLSDHLSAVLRQADDDARERAELRQMLRETQVQLADAYSKLDARIPQQTAPAPVPNAAPTQPYAAAQRPLEPGLVERVRRFLYGERRR